MTNARCLPRAQRPTTISRRLVQTGARFMRSTESGTIRLMTALPTPMRVAAPQSARSPQRAYHGDGPARSSESETRLEVIYISP
jgi:hypothetical protein